MKTCRDMTNEEARPLIALALAGLLLMAISARGEDADQSAYLSADGSTYYMMSDVTQGFDWNNVERWVGAQDNIAMKGVVLIGATVIETGKWVLNVGAASIKNAKADPLEGLAQAYLMLRLTDNDPAEWFDDDEEDVKGFKTAHNATETRTGGSRTGVAIDRHGCSVETSSSTTPITVDASFGESGSSSCEVTVGSSEEE
jgi:hypothetical protein